jgi:2'-5' RNA ligase
LNSVDEKIRAFVGFQLSVEVAQAIVAFINDMKASVPDDGITWVEPHNVHVTLRFLGDAVDFHMIALLVELLKAVSLETRPFVIRVRGLGVFPSQQRPRTVWVGMVSEELNELASRVDRAAVRCGFQSETRPFKPHITIARVRKIRHWKTIRGELGDRGNLDFGLSSVDHVSIYRSIKDAKARIYEEIGSFPLAGVQPTDRGPGSI